MKYPVLSICVRTQNDFRLIGGISVHPNNKTRLKRLIFVYNGRYTRKRHMNRTGTQQKRIFIQYSYYNLAYLCTKTC